jgi:hypothetical protein
LQCKIEKQTIVINPDITIIVLIKNILKLQKNSFTSWLKANELVVSDYRLSGFYVCHEFIY